MTTHTGNHSPPVIRVKIRCSAWLVALVTTTELPAAASVLVMTIADGGGGGAKCAVHRVPSKYRCPPFPDGSGYPPGQGAGLVITTSRRQIHETASISQAAAKRIWTQRNRAISYVAH